VAGQRRAIARELREAAREVKEAFEQTTEGWKERPTFELVPRGDMAIVVGTDEQRYQWLDEGTEPYTIPPPIVPTTKKALTIRSPGTPATQPRQLSSSGGKRGGVVAIRRRVNKPIRHPGIKPREWSDMLEEEYDEKLPRLLQRAIDQGEDEGRHRWARPTTKAGMWDPAQASRSI
jgi:hypothetical protein